jgi:hypothetical protein
LNAGLFEKVYRLSQKAYKKVEQRKAIDPNIKEPMFKGKEVVV